MGKILASDQTIMGTTEQKPGHRWEIVVRNNPSRMLDLVPVLQDDNTFDGVSPDTDKALWYVLVKSGRGRFPPMIMKVDALLMSGSDKTEYCISALRVAYCGK